MVYNNCFKIGLLKNSKYFVTLYSNGQYQNFRPISRTFFLTNVKLGNNHLQPKFLPPSKMEDKFLNFSYSVFISNPKYEGLVIDIIRPNYIACDEVRISELDSLQADLIEIIYQTKINPASDFRKDIENLDSKCALNISKMSMSQMTKIFSAWHILLGLKVFDRKLRFFSKLTLFWKNNLKVISSPQLLMVLFYTTQGKAEWAPLIFRHLEYYQDDLSFEEWVVACHCSFKLKIKMNPSILLKISKKSIENINSTEIFCLITVLKAMRLAQYWDPTLWELLVKYVNKHAKTFNFSECAHFLASFANVRFYNNVAYKHLEDRGIELLTREPRKNLQIGMRDTFKLHGSLYPRAKDIARFLWALSHVNHNCSDSCLVNFIKAIDIIMENYDKYPQYLVDSLVSLSVYNLYPRRSISLIFNDHFIEKCLNLRKVKPLHQLFFIKVSLGIENSFFKTKVKENNFERISNKLNRPLYKELQNREGLNDFVNLVKDFSRVTDDQVRCMYILPHIELASVVLNIRGSTLNSLPAFLCKQHLATQDLALFKNFNLVSVEILNNSVCLIGQPKKPIGLLTTKIRQLEKLRVKVVCLSPAEVSECKVDPSLIEKYIFG